MPHRLVLRGRAGQLYVYSGRSVLIAGRDGTVRGNGSEGFHVANTRVLTEEWLEIAGAELRCIAASPVGADASLAYYEVGEREGVERNTVFLEQRRFVGDGLATTLKTFNFARSGSVDLSVAWHLAADFADSDDTESDHRRVTTVVDNEWEAGAGRLTFRSTDPRLPDSCTVTIHGVDATWDGCVLAFPVSVKARESVEASLLVEAEVADDHYGAPTPEFSAHQRRPAARLQAQLADEAPTLRSSNATVERAWNTAINDLASLPLGLDEGPAAPVAGLPKYQQLFGRDTLTIGWQSLLAMSTPLRDALRLNAAWQGDKVDDWLDEEPGKMIHQARWGPASRLGKDPFTRYYGDWATVPDFLIMLGQYLAWTSDFKTVRELLPAARKAIGWLDRYADLDGDGFIEYRTRSERGVKNQGWLDSGDAIVDERGEIVPNPIATTELQGYFYAALQQSGFVFMAMGDVGFGIELNRRSQRLKRRFERSFWMEESGFYAMGLGPGGQQIRSIASNPGHVLAAGLARPDRGRQVARRLMEPDMFSGWGVRTLSADHPFFNPFSYHRGSVWPVDQATIAFGFARYGAVNELDRLAHAFFDTTDLFDENRLPEVVGGIQRDEEHPHPGVYPDSCEPQGWSASAVVMMVQALLGMIAIAPTRLLLVDPHLPEWLPDLTLEGICVGRQKVDIYFNRTPKGDSRWRVTGRQGNLIVVRQPPPQSPAATAFGRVSALAGSAFGR